MRGLPDKTWLFADFSDKMKGERLPRREKT
jgi:hypothetical protein